MTAPADAIRARRKLTNKLIAAHDAARLRPFLYAEATMITGDGSLIVGARAIVAAFAGQFADPAVEARLPRHALELRSASQDLPAPWAR